MSCELRKVYLLTDKNKEVRLPRYRASVRRHTANGWDRIPFTDEKLSRWSSFQIFKMTDVREPMLLDPDEVGSVIVTLTFLDYLTKLL